MLTAPIRLMKALATPGTAGAPQGDVKNFLGIFVGIRQNGDEFGEVHTLPLPRDDIKVLGGSI